MRTSSDKLGEFSLETLANIATFEAVERQIIIDLTQAIPSAAPSDLQVFSRIIGERLDNYWASRHKDDDILRKYRLLYSALAAAIELFGLRLQFGAGFHYAVRRLSTRLTRVSCTALIAPIGAMWRRRNVLVWNC